MEAEAPGVWWRKCICRFCNISFLIFTKPVMDKNTQYEYPSIHHRLIGYPYRVWILSILALPILDGLIYLILEKGHLELNIWSIVWYLFLLPVLTAFSAPSMIVYMLVFWRMTALKIPALLIKLLLSIVAIGGIWLTAYLVKGIFLLDLFNLNSSIIYLIIFSSIIFIFSAAFNLKEK